MMNDYYSIGFNLKTIYKPTTHHVMIILSQDSAHHHLSLRIHLDLTVLCFIQNTHSSYQSLIVTTLLK